MLKIASVFFAIAVPFLAARDAAVGFCSSCLQGWGLAIDMWQE